MKSLTTRRACNFAVLLFAVALAIVLSWVSTAALRDTAKLSGVVLLALVVFLALYNVRKKLSFLPLGSSATWLQLHIYVGLLTSVIFGIHIHWRMPSGALESVLAVLYASVFVSGVFGLIISRSFARRLTTRGAEVLFERISIYRKRLQADVEDIVSRCLVETESSAVPQFYNTRLKPFFERPRHFWQHLFQSHRARQALLKEISDHYRYLNEVEQKTMREIADRVESKDDLDYHFALQATIKCWLFAHVPLTYALLVFAAFHSLLVNAFSGGAP